LFEIELRAALENIRSAPEFGAEYLDIEGRTYRRVLMVRTRYHVYYRVVDATQIRVLCIWSAVRGRRPRFG
jgi:plasmid stabilization system protein ParE